MATTITRVSEAIEEALKQAGFFDDGKDDAARLDTVEPAVANASRQLGVKLSVSRDPKADLCTVMADGLAGVVTIVAQRTIERDGRESVNPDFGVTWSMT